MANSYRGTLYGAGPLRSREGISARAAAGSDEIQLRIDPVHADLDEEIDGLHRKLTQLKTVAQEIESEAKFQNDFVTQLQMTLIKSSSRGKEQHEKVEQEHHPAGVESCHACHPLCALLFLRGLLLVQNLQKTIHGYVGAKKLLKQPI